MFSIDEIFDEIEKIIEKYYNVYIFGGDFSYEEQEAIMDFSLDVTTDVCNLRKKFKLLFEGK